jgi:hypothetical protein
LRAVRNKQDLARLHSILNEQDKEVLVRILIDRSCQQPDLADYLFALSANKSPKAVDSLSAIDEAFEQHISLFHDEDEGHVDLPALHSALLNIVRERLESADYKTVTSLVKRALSKLREYLPAIEDWSTAAVSESAILTTELDELRRLAENELALPPVQLAEQLFERLQDQRPHYDDNAIDKDMDVMGPEGAKHFQQLLEKYWNSIFATGGYYRSADLHKESRLLRLMTKAARLTGELEFLLKLHGGDLSRRDQFFAVARMYRDLGDHQTAIEFAEKALTLFKDADSSRLKEFLFEQYAKADRHSDAIELLFKKFAECLELQAYSQLKQYVLQYNSPTWTYCRDRCYDRVLDVISKEERPPGQVLYETRDLLVQMRMTDELWDLAWGEARRHGCSQRVVLELAQKAWKGDPAAAYKRLSALVELNIDQKNQKAYDEAIELLRTMKEIAAYTKSPERFRVYVEALALRHQSKTSVLRRLRLKGMLPSDWR